MDSRAAPGPGGDAPRQLGGAARRFARANARPAAAGQRLLRLGATFSPVPAFDLAFNTTDLFVVMPLADVEERYLQYFGVEHPPAPLAA